MRAKKMKKSSINTNVGEYEEKIKLLFYYKNKVSNEN
jgi:hypothetical protein